MNTAIQRLLGRALRKPDSSVALSGKLPLTEIQEGMRRVVSDCSDLRCKRIQFKINQAKTPTDLWALRSDLHQCIANQHSERVAAARINDVAPLFEGWIPSNQLIRIQPGFRNSEK